MPDGTVSQYQYDAIGNRTAEILNGSVTPYQYNNLGQLLKVGTHSTHYEYDGAGNVVGITKEEAQGARHRAQGDEDGLMAHRSWKEELKLGSSEDRNVCHSRLRAGIQ